MNELQRKNSNSENSSVSTSQATLNSNIGGNGGSSNSQTHVRISQSKLPSLNQIISDTTFNSHSNVGSQHPSNIPKLSSPSVHMSLNSSNILNQIEDNSNINGSNNRTRENQFEVEKDSRFINNSSNIANNNNNNNDYSYTLYKSTSASDLQNSPNPNQFNFRPIQGSPLVTQSELLKKRKYEEESSQPSSNIEKQSPTDYSSPLNTIVHTNGKGTGNQSTTNNNRSSIDNEEDQQPQIIHSYKQQNFNSPHHINNNNNNNSPHHSQQYPNLNSIGNGLMNQHHHHEESSSDDSIDSNDDVGYELLQHNNIANGLMIFQDALSTEEVYNVYNKFKTPQSKQQLKQQQK